jgi:hypothetical protein
MELAFFSPLARQASHQLSNRLGCGAERINHVRRKQPVIVDGAAAGVAFVCNTPPIGLTGPFQQA